ncbi:MAG: SufD family Fe-S cluster assembly protein [Desulfobacteraceae bacterium]
MTSTAANAAPIFVDRVLPDEATILAGVGVIAEAEERSGTFLLRDLQTICAESRVKGLEFMPIKDALERYDGLHGKYYWSAVPADTDEVTSRCAAQTEPFGYFIRVKKGTRVRLPCQAGLFMASPNADQVVHNIVILEERAELELITGCATGCGKGSGSHVSVSEFYIGRHAFLTSMMVQKWGPGATVRPVSGTVVEENGALMSSYISLGSKGDIRFNPRTRLNGRSASAKLTTVILGVDGATIETGGEIHLNAPDTSAELVHRGVCTGGRMLQKGLLLGNEPCRAHVDCAGLLLDPGHEGFILSVPGLQAFHPDARMSHEASVGRISPEQIEYLQSRGLEERQAVSMIVRGFLDQGIKGLGPKLDAGISEIWERAGHGEGEE